MRRVLLVACGIFAPGWSAILAADEPADAGKKLQGAWVATMAERDGKAAEDVIGHRLAFKGLRFTITSRTGKLLYQGTVSLQPDRKPPAIDFKHDSGDLKGKVWKGIYALDDKTLKICDNGPDPTKDRPTGFIAKERSGHIVIVFKRKAKFTISKETTFVLGPIDKDGYIDYAAALNERLRQGVTPKNNANVLLWQAFGPRAEGKLLSPEFFRLLGMEPPPERGEYFVDFSGYLKSRIKGDDAEKRIGDLEDRMPRVQQRPWTAKEHPHVANWLKANAAPLALVIQASKRQEYFSPLAPATNEALLSANLPGLQKLRELAMALTARAMLHTGEKRYEEAWQDLLACHRLSRLIGRGATLIEALIGMAFEGIAAETSLAFLERAPLDAKKVKACLRDLQALPRFSGLVERWDLTERIMFLDVAMLAIRHGSASLRPLLWEAKLDEPVVRAITQALDWDAMLREANNRYDRLVAAARQGNRSLRKKPLRKFEDDLRTLKNTVLVQAVKVMDGKEDAEALGKFCADFLLPQLAGAVGKAQEAADRTEQIQRNLQTAFALAAYRGVQGRYPGRLEMLAPDYLPRIPEDIFCGKALIYRPKDKGYILYSVGMNERDDGGRGYQDDPSGDDLVVRMPLPNRR